MARVTIEDCLERVESRFALVHLAVRRVLQIRSGVPSLVSSKNKEIVVALREIAAGKVTPENIRQFEESKLLPEAAPLERVAVTRDEVQEIISDAAAHFDAATVVTEGGSVGEVRSGDVDVEDLD